MHRDAASPTPRWRRRKADRPGEVLSAALAVFAEKGFAAARVEDIAARAGLSKGTLYLYFSSKDEIFRALVRERLVPNIATFEAHVGAYDGPSADLVRSFITVIAGRVAGSELAALPKLIIAEASHFPALRDFYRAEVISRGLGVLAGIVARGQARGEFRPMDPLNAARLIIAPLLLTALWRQIFGPGDPEPFDIAAFLRDHADVVLKGLRNESSAQ